MTNYEKYKDDIIKTLLNNCENCQFNDECGSDTFRKWLDSEYVELEKEEVDWSKGPIDTKVLVSSDGVTWYKRYFAGIDTCTNECLAWLGGATSWAIRSKRAWKYVKLYKEDEE